MNIWIKKIGVSAVIAAICIGTSASASAQGSGGGGGGGQRMMMGFGGGGSPNMLLSRTDVKDDLKLTDDQKTKLKAAQDKAQEDGQAMFQNAQASGSFDREAMQAAGKKIADAYNASVKEILTADQAKRLMEIFVQLQGNSALTNEDVQKELKLTDDQKSKIKSLQEAQQKATQELFQKVRDQEIDRDQMRESMTKNNTKLKDELGKVLTDDQTKKFKEMGGKPFKATDKPPTRPGGGGGGGF